MFLGCAEAVLTGKNDGWCLTLCPWQDVHKVTELEKAMERQKLKIDLESEKSDVWRSIWTSYGGAALRNSR